MEYSFAYRRRFWERAKSEAQPPRILIGRDGKAELSARRAAEPQKITEKEPKPEGPATMVIYYSNLVSPEFIRTESDKSPI
jgi:hypothetical protein